MVVGVVNQLTEAPEAPPAPPTSQGRSISHFALVSATMAMAMMIMRFGVRFARRRRRFGCRAFPLSLLGHNRAPPGGGLQCFSGFCDLNLLSSGVGLWLSAVLVLWKMCVVLRTTMLLWKKGRDGRWKKETMMMMMMKMLPMI